jgi:hypothetical protein
VSGIIGERGDRARIGRQIVLPMSKAFEIAWKGIRIRLWRSLITMSGIVLAIAFLMSVWTAGVFNRALRAVPEGHELYPLVQGALEAEAIAAGAVRMRCVVVRQGEGPAVAQVTAASSIRTFLDGQEAFRADAMPADGAALRGLLAEEEPPDAVVLDGLPPELDEAETVAALEGFVRNGGALLVYGTAGLGEGPQGALESLLPAEPQEGTVEVDGAAIEPGERAVQLRWQGHPPATFHRTDGKAGALALASAQGQGLAWQSVVGEGYVTWYPVTAASAGDPDVISWFVRGRTLGEMEQREQGSGSPVLRLVARGLGGESSGDMRGIWLVTLSLMVCVVGITNAMLMSVTERFREIGTMKCLGALDKFVVKLFLIESSLQGVVGSVAGALIGFTLAFLRALFTFHVKDVETGKGYWLALRFFPGLSLVGWVGVALAVGIVLSVVAAIYPAIRAARMEPVQAMRTEA